MEARPHEIGIADSPNNKETAASERRIDGVAVSKGVGIGRVAFFEREFHQLEDAADIRSKPEVEIARLHAAVSQSSTEIKTLIEAGTESANGHLTDILNIQLLILEQSSFVTNIEENIREGSVTAETALDNVKRFHVEKQAGAHDPHHREKRVDIEDVCNRIAAALSGSSKASKNIYRDCVVAAYELTPSEIVEISSHIPAAIVTERGGWTSHSAILARDFQIPMVSGVKSVEAEVADGESVIVDGLNGKIIVDPTELSLSIYAVQAVAPSSSAIVARDEKGTITADGLAIMLRANADSATAYAIAKESGAVGIGLFRSESLITRPGRIPDEEQQFRAYCKIGEAVGEDCVRIRTFDIGPEQFSTSLRETEINPALGLRSIRLSLREVLLFREQIRAILRAASKYRIDIVLPLISGVAEVMEAREIVEEEREMLAKRGIEHGNPRFGAMIEVPSAVFVAREIAVKVDFLALGTNDLVQYLLAVDRDNDQVSDLYQTLHPAVIRALRTVIAAAESTNRPLIVCGEMAGSAFYVPLLIGLGARKLSMNINSISQIRRLISGITLAQCEVLAGAVESAETADQVEEILRKFYKEHWASLFPTGLLDAKHR